MFRVDVKPCADGGIPEFWIAVTYDGPSGFPDTMFVGCLLHSATVKLRTAGITFSTSDGTHYKADDAVTPVEVLNHRACRLIDN